MANSRRVMVFVAKECTGPKRSALQIERMLSLTQVALENHRYHLVVGRRGLFDPEGKGVRSARVGGSCD